MPAAANSFLAALSRVPSCAVRSWVFASGLLCVAPGMAEAYDPGGPSARAPVSAERSMASGAFATWSMSARTDTQSTQVQLSGGYDVVRAGAQFDSLLETRVLGRLSLRAGGSYAESAAQLRPVFGAKLDVLRQETHGVDLAMASGYEPYGFNTVPALASSLAVGRRLGRTQLLTNVGYAVGLEEGERYGDLRFAALQPVLRRLRVGVDSRFRLDLERDQEEPENEPDWEFSAGPLVTATQGAFALSSGVGVSALRRRLQPGTDLGAVAYLSLAAVF